MESSNATQESKVAVSAGRIIPEEGQFTTSDFAGCLAGSDLEPYSTTPGVRVAPIEEKPMQV